MLEVASDVLGPFHETVFRAMLRRLRGEGKAVVADPPPEILPFLQFKPQQAVQQPKVREALITYLETDAGMPGAVQTLWKTPPPTMDAMRRAAALADVRALAQQASAAAVHRPDGWAALVLMAAGARLGIVAGRESAMAEAGRRSSDLERRGQKRVEKLEAIVTRLEAALDKATADVGAAREQRRELRRDLDDLRRAAAAADDRIREETSAAAEACARADDLGAELTSLRRRAREDAATYREGERGLRSEVEALRAARVPDLERQARQLESLAGELRAAMRSVRRASDASDASDASGAIENRSRPRPTSSTRQRRRVQFPMGMLPDGVPALRWVLGQPDIVLLVDGYNVTRQSERGWGDLRGDDQRRVLVSRCAQARRVGGAEIRIVFDAAEPDSFVGRRHVAGVRYEFSNGMIADDRLVEILEELPSDVAVMAVTSDRELRGRLEAKGSATVTSEVFLEAAGAPER